MEDCLVDESGTGRTRDWFDPIHWDRDRSWQTSATLILRRVDPSTEELKVSFESLRSAWHREIGPSSSFTKITSSPAYRQIVNMGEKVLPLIFQDLRRSPAPDFWFDALVEITKENPVPDKYRGYSRRMTKIWLKWARAHKYA